MAQHQGIRASNPVYRAWIALTTRPWPLELGELIDGADVPGNPPRRHRTIKQYRKLPPKPVAQAA